ncbi:MAG: hypothetical protein IJB88_00990 [Clostridia bacterium]|nr:hypothetical protein [Clostridia bacterium]
MIKKFLVLLFIPMLILALSSCQKETDSAEPDVLYRFHDMTSFYQWVESQGELLSENALLSTNEAENLVIPTLQIDDYGLEYVDVHPNCFRYSFLPLERLASQDRVVDPKDIVVVIKTSQIDFDAQMESMKSRIPAEDEHGLTKYDGFAYRKKHNTWYINHNGTFISIVFPDTIVLESTDQISEYFTFEEYGSRNEHSLVTE